MLYTGYIYESIGECIAVMHCQVYQFKKRNCNEIILLMWTFPTAYSNFLLKKIMSFLSGLGTAFFSVQNVPFFPVLKRECYVLFRSFLEFLATYETQKNFTFFSVLFKRKEKNAKNVTFFLKERKRTQRT